MVWAKRIAKFLTGLAIMFVVVDVICAVSTYIKCSSIVSNRLNDLVRIVSQENCLEKNTSFVSFQELLQTTVEQNQYVLFSNNSQKLYYDGLALQGTGPNILAKSEDYTSFVDMNYAVYVGSDKTDTTYYTYVTAPQRGEEIVCTIKAYASAPFFMFGFSGRINIPIEKTYTTLGLKYYKGK